ncbi:T9SS type A sorting domain-containing protein [candidate division KSB1 bacterium]|nr:T9SS type A sorting domain-containing protein [candidate division KSB1 bacterium]
MTKYIIFAVIMSSLHFPLNAQPYGEEIDIVTSSKKISHFDYQKLTDSTFVLIWKYMYQQYFNNHLDTIGSIYAFPKGVPLTYLRKNIILKNGNHTVFWGQEDGDYVRFYAQFLTESGELSGNPILINPNFSSWGGGSGLSATTLNDGNILCSWHNWRPGGRYGQMLSPNGYRIDEEFKMNEDYDYDMKDLIATIQLPNDQLVLFSETDPVYYIWSVEEKRTLKKVEFKSSYYINWVNAFPLHQNITLAVWEDWPNQIMSGIIFDENFEPMSDEITFGVSNYFHCFPISPDEFITILQSGANGSFNYTLQKYNNIGETISSAKLFDETYLAVIKLISNETLLFIWFEYNHQNQQRDFFAQKLNTRTLKLGRIFKINQESFEYSVIYMHPIPNGEFLIFWSDNYGNIKAKRFSKDPIHHNLQSFKALSPSNDESVKTINPLFTWQKSSKQNLVYSYELKYFVYYDSTPEFLHPQLATVEGDTSMIIKGLTPGTTYYWKVLARNLAGDSLWSSNTNGFLVKHTATKVDGGLNNTNSPMEFKLMQNYPNPFNPTTHIQFYLDENAGHFGQKFIRIYNMLGQLVAIIDISKLGPGMHTVIFNGMDFWGNPLPSGVYICQLVAGNQMSTIRVSLMK